MESRVDVFNKWLQDDIYKDRAMIAANGKLSKFYSAFMAGIEFQRKELADLRAERDEFRKETDEAAHHTSELNIQRVALEAERDKLKELLKKCVNHYYLGGSQRETIASIEKLLDESEK